MAAYILLAIILLILVLLVFSENRDTKAPKTGKSPEELKLEEIKRADAEKRLREEAKRAKEESKKRLEASKKAEEKQKAAEAQARKAKEQEEQQKALKEAEEAQRKAEEAEARKREAAVLKAEEERKAKEEAQRLEAEKKAAEKEAREREAAEAEAKKLETEQKEAEEEAKKEEKVVVELPEYSAFDHSRLLEMGLSDEDATDFVKELIPQIEEQLPLIEKALQESDFQQMERLTHNIKGSATNIGTGGVSDLIVEYNTFLKTDNDLTHAQAYYEELIHQLDKLKAQYL